MGYSTSSSGSDDEDDYKSKRKDTKLLKSKRRKEKKRKKKSKKHKRVSTSESSASGSGSEAEWVEKELPRNHPPQAASGNPQGSTSGKTTEGTSFKRPVEDSDWNEFNSFIPTYSNSAKKEKRQTKQEWDTVRTASKPGQHSRESNPYWKDGGDGLPSTEEQSQTRTKEQAAPTAIGDGGLHWLRKAYQRAKEQAAEEGRSLEDVAAERWGSLSNFYAMLEEAEVKSKDKDSRGYGKRDDRHGVRETSFKKPKRDSGSSDEDRRADARFGGSKHGHASSRDSGFRRPTWKKQSASTSQAENRPRSPSPPRPPPKSPTVKHLVSEKQRETIPELEKPASPPPLTDQEMNALSAKILKAEMLGNMELVSKLKGQHTEAEAKRQAFIKCEGYPQESSKRVVTKIVMDSQNRGSRKDKRSETHQQGQRVRYFPDDDKQTLQNMFQREKSNTVENENALFSRLAGKGMKSKPTDDYDLDDIFADNASSAKKAEKEKEREVQKVINDEKFYNKMVVDCPWCFDGQKLEKHIVASMAEKSYLCIPPFQSLSEGHCLIVPMAHVSSATELDEDVWEEMQKFRHTLVRMFKEDDQDVVIFETAMSLQRHPHMYLECVPIPKEVGELAPIYFKKAIQECETEWAQNKKLVELRNRGVRKAIPKGLPYFSVDFGDDSGFAHVIEDERSFPRNFAQEIIGGMMELDHSLWRKRRNDTFKDQREKVMKFLHVWGPFDWTRDG